MVILHIGCHWCSRALPTVYDLLTRAGLIGFCASRALRLRLPLAPCGRRLHEGRSTVVVVGAGLAGVAAYNALWKDATISSVVLWTSVASALIGLAPLALVSHANRAWGLDDRLFSLGDDVVQSALGEATLLALAARHDEGCVSAWSEKAY